MNLMLSQQEKELIRVIVRSPDRGEGWRQCSPTPWKWIRAVEAPELLEFDDENLRVRLTAAGEAFVKYA